jgi:replicative DNA helicase
MPENKNILSKIKGGLTNVNQNPDLLQMGKIMPHSIELEEAVLGAILIDKNALPSVIDILRQEVFYKPAHQKIYEIIIELFQKSQGIDILTVHDALKKAKLIEEIGGPNYLIELSNKVGSAANIEFHARILVQKYIQRELIRVSSDVIKDSYEDSKDVFELLDDAEKSLYDITDQNLNTAYERLGGLAAKVQKEIEELSTKEEGLTGITTGFEELDNITSGWQKSDMIIIAARPGMGKTAFALSLARNAAQSDHPTAIFSLEMSKMQLTQRLLAMESEINSKKIRNGQLDEYQWKKLHEAVERMSETEIYIDDTPGINIFELRAKCRRMKQNHGIELIIIDYLQLMTSAPNQGRGNREQEISSISRALKGMAKELNVPVIALSQLSRAVETRGGNKRPQLSDLRESGAIEQDADIVSFVFRPDYYEAAEDFEGPRDIAEIIISKHRNGALGTVELKFIKEFTKFVEVENMHFSGFGESGPDPLGTQNVITKSSKMNGQNNGDGDIPF